MCESILFTTLYNDEFFLFDYRRMFPSIQLNVNGLNKQDYYYVVMEIAPASDRRHKYCGNSGGNDENANKGNIGWSFAGPAEPQPPFLRRVFFHPDNPSTGEHWMQNSINFSKLKLTNNIVDHRNNVSNMCMLYNKFKLIY